MATEAEVGCARPTGGPVGGEKKAQRESVQLQKEEHAMIKVGQKAPDFNAPGYQQGKFINIKLSDYLGKWVVLCFYRGGFSLILTALSRGLKY